MVEPASPLIDFFDVLDQSDRDQLIERVWHSPRWQYGAHSTDRGVLFWQMNLRSDPFFQRHMFAKISDLLDGAYKLCRVYANGQTHGQCGTLHIDADEDSPANRYYTFLYYANSDWNPEWGGHTMIVDRDQKIHSRYPYPNSGVLFDSTLLHVGLEPTALCPDMRVTIAFKLELLQDPA